MLELKYCPVCSKQLQFVNGAYVCTNENCSIIIMDNHILELQSIARLLQDEPEDKHMISESGAYTPIQVVVMNQKTAEDYSLQKHNVSSVVISITSRCSHEAFIVPNNIANIVDVLKMQFNDEDTENENFGGITYTEAKSISDFVKRYKEDKRIGLIIVHCEAGQSRSAGVAAAILKYLYDNDTAIFDDKRYTPNMLCYRKVLTALMYEE